MYKTATALCTDCELEFDVTVNEVGWVNVEICFCPLCGSENVETGQEDDDDESGENDEGLDEDEDS